MKTAATVATGCLLAIVASVAVTAQKDPKTPAATGNFRCETDLPGEPCPGTDRVRDDGAIYAFLYSNGEGSQLNGNGEYYLWLQTGGADRSLVVDLANQLLGPADCEPNCYYQQVWGNMPTINVYDGWLRTNVLEADGVTELKGGLLALPCSSVPTPRASRMLITFTNATNTNATATVSIALRWYADAFPPSNMVQVTRHSRTSFTIEAADGAAKAVVVGSALVRGKLSGTRQEGVFNMPFKLNVSVPSAPAKTGCTG